MAQVHASADEVYRVLLERSGLLREPVEGQTDFVHRTFQEYLGAAEAVATDDIGALVANAWTDVWSEVVVMAAGHAMAAQRTELIGGLLNRASEHRGSALGGSLRLLAVACLETSPELPPELRREVREAAESLLPPRTMSAAATVARSGGTFALDLLARSEPGTAAEVAATIRAAADIGDPAALPLLARFGTDARKPVVRELLRAWPRFDPNDYARTVLSAYPLDSEEWFEIRDLSLIPTLHHLASLRRLQVYTADGSPVDPVFLTDLPDLRHLMVADITGLEALAGTAITHFMQAMGSLADRPPLSLAPLADMAELNFLVIFGRRPIDLAALQCHDRLTGLHLCALDTQDALEQLPRLPHLHTIGIGGMTDLTNLAWLQFLNSPFQVQLHACPGLEDISVVARWEESLENVELYACPAVDLAPLRALRNLRHLNLTASGTLDLTPVASLPNLQRIRLDSSPLPDLHPLKDSPALAVLSVRGVSEIDLEPLAGRERLTSRLTGPRPSMVPANSVPGRKLYADRSAR